MKYLITFSEIIRYRPYEIEAENREKAQEIYQDMDLEKEVGIADVETEWFCIEEVQNEHKTT